jgi:glucan 1,3-beta-glucosidase
MVQNYLTHSNSERHQNAKPALKGVNLGGWLVLEKWITPSLFNGLKASDEYTLCLLASPAVTGAIRKHRDNFITKEDFYWLADHGIESLRLPVGYWVFGDETPYIGAIEYVDKAFAWAEQAGLKILLDLHAAPGSQNGWDHSGRAGSASWHKSEANIIKSLQVISKLVLRYGKYPQFLGIELLNEPIPAIKRKKLKKYYEAAYRLIRARCGQEAWVVIHDSFRPRRWYRQFRGKQFPGLYIDTHQYQCFSRKDKALTLDEHLNKTRGKVHKQLTRMRRRHRVIVGEWSLALDTAAFKGADPARVAEGIKTYGTAQLQVYEEANAWFFWTYRTEGGGSWSFRDATERGLLPDLDGAGPADRN